MKMVLGDTDGATEDVRKYIELDGGDPTIMASLGQLYESAEEPARAAECYAMAVETDVHAYVDRARCLLMTEDFAGARKSLEAFRSLSAEDKDGEVSSMFGVCLMNDGEYTEAAEAFRTAAQQGYATPQLMYEQAMMCSYIAGDYETAVKDGAKTIEMKKAAGESVASTEILTGACHLVLGEFSEAEAAIQTAVDEDPDLEDTRYYLGVCAMSREDYEKAAGFFTESIEREESVTACLYNRAVCRLNLDDIDGAKEDFALIVERDDDQDLTGQAAIALDTIRQMEESGLS